MQKIGEVVRNFILWPTKFLSQANMYAIVDDCRKHILGAKWIVGNNNLQSGMNMCFMDETCMYDVS